MKKEFKVGDRVYDSFHLKAATITKAGNEYKIKYDDGTTNRSVNGTQYILIDPSKWTLVTTVPVDESISEGATADTTVPKSENHPDKILMWICIGHMEGPQSHMHIFRDDPNTVPWDQSITICLDKSEYFHDPTMKSHRNRDFNPKLTTKETKRLVNHLNTIDRRYNHTWWKTLIKLWNSKNHKSEGDTSKGWLDPDTEMPNYIKHIKE